MPEQISDSQHVYPIALNETNLYAMQVSLNETTSAYIRERTEIMEEIAVKLTEAGLPKTDADSIDLSGVIETFGDIIDKLCAWSDLTDVRVETYIDLASRKDALFVRVGESEEPLMMITDTVMSLFSNDGRMVPEHIKTLLPREFVERRGEIFDFLNKVANMKRKKKGPTTA